MVITKLKTDCRSIEIQGRNEFYKYSQDLADRSKIQGAMVIDIDNLKYINRKISPSVGDIVIDNVCENIKSMLPQNAVIGRTGGDEFSVFIPELENSEEIEKTAKNLVLFQRNVFEHEGHFIKATVSIGLHVVEPYEEYKSITELFDKAEIALVRAKKLGKNQYIVFEPSQLDEMNRCDAVILALQRALSDNALKVEFQPLFKISTGELVGLEALCRLSDDILGSIPPLEFIKIAQENNLICDIDKQMLNKVCSIIRNLVENGYNVVPVSVNISPIYFMRPEFLSDLEAALRANPIDHSLLSVELIESALIEPPAQDVINRLNETGIKVFLDDFGTGYANLKALQELKIDILKMDKSLIDKIEENGENIIIKKMLEIADVFNMGVVAEGIETKIQFDQLRRMNCEVGQGFFLGKPMDINKTKIFLKEASY